MQIICVDMHSQQVSCYRLRYLVMSHQKLIPSHYFYYKMYIWQPEVNLIKLLYLQFTSQAISLADRYKKKFINEEFKNKLGNHC